MHRTYPNIVPVANKYLGHKLFLKSQADHEENIKHAHGLVDQSEPTPRPHCAHRLRQKQLKEHELAMIEKDNERLRMKMMKNGPTIDTHNDYVLHSLNLEQRHREQAEHESEVHRLQRQISHIRPSYPTREFEHEYAKTQDVKKIIRKFSTNEK